MSHDVQIERPLPHSADTERLLLGAVFVGHAERHALLDTLDLDDFYLAPHQVILRTMQDLRVAGHQVDVLSVSEELCRTKRADAAGGLPYLSQVLDGVPNVFKLDYHIQRLKDLSQLRKAIWALHELYESAFEDPGPIEEFLDHGIEKLSAIAREADANRDETVSFRDAAVALLQSLQAGAGPRIFSDLRALDDITGGFRAGEVAIITGGTGHGKTLFVQQMCRRACRDTHHVLFCSGEMLAPHLVSRGLDAQAGVKPWKLRLSERLDDEDWRRLTRAAGQGCNACRILDKELSLPRFRRVARRLKNRCGLGFVVVDYDELVEAPGKDEFEQQRNLVRGAKSLALELEIPVVIVSQLRKTLTSDELKKPTLPSLYGSGAKAKHASCVIFVDRPYVRELKGDETEARVFVLKNRDGRVGRVKASFNVETLRFVDAPDEPTDPDVPEHPRLPYRESEESQP